MSISHNWVLWAVLAAVFAALTTIFAKIGLEGVDSDYATLIRTVVIVVVLGVFVYATNRWRNPASLPPRTLTFLVLSALATGASWICYFRALKMGDASRVSPIDKLSVVLVALFATIFLGEKLTLRDWGAVGLVTAGVLLLSLKQK